LYNVNKEGFQNTFQGPDFGEIIESRIYTLWKSNEELEELERNRNKNLDKEIPDQ